MVESTRSETFASLLGGHVEQVVLLTTYDQISGDPLARKLDVLQRSRDGIIWWHTWGAANPYQYPCVTRHDSSTENDCNAVPTVTSCVGYRVVGKTIKANCVPPGFELP